MSDTNEVTSTNDAANKTGPAKKPEFDVTTAVDADGNPIPLNDEQKMLAVPHNWTSAVAHIGVRMFASRDLHLEWRALCIEERAAQALQRANDLRDEAALERAGGDPVAKNRAKARKVAGTLEAALAALAAEGVDPDEMLAELGLSRSDVEG